MTPRWRVTLRLRRLLRLLVEQEVPIVALQLQVARACELADSDLVQSEANNANVLASMSGELSRRMTEQVLGEEPLAGTTRELLRDARDELRKVLRRLHLIEQWDATADAVALTSVILRLDEALQIGKTGVQE
jgi:hypothetical protein